jgi:hypothetical protein
LFSVAAVGLITGYVLGVDEGVGVEDATRVSPVGETTGVVGLFAGVLPVDG